MTNYVTEELVMSKTCPECGTEHIDVEVHRETETLENGAISIWDYWTCADGTPAGSPRTHRGCGKQSEEIE